MIYLCIPDSEAIEFRRHVLLLQLKALLVSHFRDSARSCITIARRKSNAGSYDHLGCWNRLSEPVGSVIERTFIFSWTTNFAFRIRSLHFAFHIYLFVLILFNVVRNWICHLICTKRKIWRTKHGGPSRRRPPLNHPVTFTLPTIGSISQSPWRPLGPLSTCPLRNIHHPQFTPPNHKSIGSCSSCCVVNGRDRRCTSAILGSRDRRCCVDCQEQVGREVALQRHPSTVQTLSNQGAKAAKAREGRNKIWEAIPQAAAN